ncbi:MAG: hypothetical protein ACE5GC_01200 [Acidimicrobiia bacterium]
MELTPALILGMWASGLAAGGAVVTGWRIVGRGYTWLTAIVVVMFGLTAAAAGGGGLAWAGALAASAAALSSRWIAVATALFSGASAAFAIAALADSPLLPVITGAIFLGAITSEMMLGHWYLVDPRLPRWALRALMAAGLVGLAGDVGYLTLEGVFDWSAAGSAMGWGFVALGGFTALLGVAVVLALREPRYSAVMAATGLSYLATLTAFGAVVVGRMVAFPG